MSLKRNFRYNNGFIFKESPMIVEKIDLLSMNFGLHQTARNQAAFWWASQREEDCK